MKTVDQYSDSPFRTSSRAGRPLVNKSPLWWATASVLLICSLFSEASADEEGDFMFTAYDQSSRISTYRESVVIDKYKGSGVNVTIPDKISGLPVKFIEHFAWENAGSVVSIKIPASLERIGFGFDKCTRLEKFDVETSNQSFKAADGVLFSKDGRKLMRFPTARSGKYKIPDSTHVVYGAFSGVIGLTEITIGKGVTLGDAMYGRSVFDGCATLENIFVDADHAELRSIDGILFDKEGKKLIQYPGGRKGHYDFPKGVIFDDYSKNGDARVSPFCGSVGITSIALPEGIKSARSGDFFGCQNLKEVKFPPSLEMIMNFSFEGCKSLTKVVFEGNAPSISRGAFKDSPNLMFVYYKGSSGFDKKWVENNGNLPVEAIEPPKSVKDQ